MIEWGWVFSILKFLNIDRLIGIDSFVDKQKKKIKKIFTVNEQVLHRAAIEKSITSNFESQVQCKSIAHAINKHKSLTTSKKFHYSDLSERYHFFHRLQLLPILNGDEAFFTEMCDAISERIDFKNIHFTLHIKKNQNNSFAIKLSDNYPGKIKSYALIYKEKADKDTDKRIKYEKGESLKGVNVILLESLLIVAETIIEIIEWIKMQGATIRNVVILFNATNNMLDLSAYGIDQKDVIIGATIDLRVVKKEFCTCKDKGKLKPLNYDEY
ncbi:hypothetical protein MBAV_000726 [Candidatus Magnetobacterium bavaricum]|uniref:Uncharacterized protein n=1 Tax=Candidatus Magnetobacterium bavaricum TaxID=29290 RepID=A0A0F3GYM2_9BACT|nr:hypothetical protein MBAV_000726 [Candidatus Magnetobacterium bavaricum]